VKFYLTAFGDARARRRQAELAASGDTGAAGGDHERAAARDKQDETSCPLRKPTARSSSIRPASPRIRWSSV
jgi:cytidylate kinase